METKRHRRAVPCSSSSAATGTTETTTTSAVKLSKADIKMELIKLGAKTDRGQLLFPQKAYAPMDDYNRKHREKIKLLVQ